MQPPLYSILPDYIALLSLSCILYPVVSVCASHACYYIILCVFTDIYNMLVFKTLHKWLLGYMSFCNLNFLNLTLWLYLSWLIHVHADHSFYLLPCITLYEYNIIYTFLFWLIPRLFPITMLWQTPLNMLLFYVCKSFSKINN